MPVTVTGRVTDETGAVLPKLTAEVRGDWRLTTEQLARGEAVTKDRERIGTVQTPAVVLKYQSRMLPILTSGARGCG